MSLPFFLRTLVSLGMLISIDHLSMVNDNIECCTVEVLCSSVLLIVVAVYRPPSGSIDEFHENLMTILNDSKVKGSRVIVAGDFNINLIKFEHLGDSDKGFIYMFSLSFHPIITKPTQFPIGN